LRLRKKGGSRSAERRKGRGDHPDERKQSHLRKERTVYASRSGKKRGKMLYREEILKEEGGLVLSP